MTEPTNTPDGTKTSEDRCPLCGEVVADSPYPRHRLVLEDESDDPNQRHERRVCSPCWDDLCETLASPM